MKKNQLNSFNKDNHSEEILFNNNFNNKNIIRCVNCNEIPILDIISRNNSISIICPFHQNACDYSEFLLNCQSKCPNCFYPIKVEKEITHNTCFKCNKIINSNQEMIAQKECLLHKKNYIAFCRTCNKHFCEICTQLHNDNAHNKNHHIFLLKELFLSKNDENFIENNLKRKEVILNSIIKYIKTIPKDNKSQNKGKQLLVLLEEKKKELKIEYLILMNYKEYKNNYKILVNGAKLLNYEKKNYSHFYDLKINFNYYDELDIFINQIRSYLQNNYTLIKNIKKELAIENFKDNENIQYIHNKNIKSIISLNESLIASGSWDCSILIYNIYINQKVYSISQPSMIFNLKKYPLIAQKEKSDIKNYGILVCIYCQINILKIQEKNSKIIGHSTICQIKGFGNFIWTSIILAPNKEIISASLDNRLSAHKLLPNDRNINEDINYCLIQSNMNEEKESITALLQIDESHFVSSSSLDLNDDPSIKFWVFNTLEDKFLLEKSIYDVYCCQYPNSIGRINEYIIGFALEYASLRGKNGGIALVDIRYKEIFSIVNTYNISCFCSINENKFFTCGFDRIHRKRYLKEFIFKKELKEIGSIEIFHYDDIISMELVKESELLVIGSDEGKITIFDNYSIC